MYGWPEHACLGCSMVADQVAHVAHLNARDTTLVFASRAPQTDIERVKARMGWEMPWYTMTDGFDADFGVDEWHGTNVFIRDGDRVFRTYFINNRGDEAMGGTWSYLDLTALGRQEEWEDSPEGYPRPRRTWWNWHDEYGDAERSQKWLCLAVRGLRAGFEEGGTMSRPSGGGGVPVEEFLPPLLSGVGAGLLGLTWVVSRVRRLRSPPTNGPREAGWFVGGPEAAACVVCWCCWGGGDPRRLRCAGPAAVVVAHEFLDLLAGVGVDVLPILEGPFEYVSR